MYSFNYFNLDIKQLEVLINILTFLVVSFLGVFVFLGNTKSWTNRLFILLALTLDAYVVANYVSLHPPSFQSQLFWIRAVMFVCALMSPTLFLLVHTFPGTKIYLKRPYLLIIILLGAISAVLSLMPYVFTSVTYPNNSPVPVPGPGMPIFFLDFVGLILASFVLLLIRYRRSADRERLQQRPLLFGIIFSFSLIILATLMSVVVLKNSNLVFLGPIFPVLLIGSIAYAIVKYELFDIKVIATNLLVFIIWIILGSKLFVSGSILEFVIDFLILTLMVVFGIFLIKSVKKEVEQREKLEVLTKQLEEANDKLQELDHIKSEFLSFASHQIKAPLAAIKGFATLIYDGTYGQVPDKVSETAHKIKDSVDRMVQLVTDFLNVRKIEEGKVEYKFEKADVVKIIKEMADEFKLLAQNKKLEFSYESTAEEAWMNVDIQRMRQVFQNLIENAIKYTDPRSAEGFGEASAGFVRVKVEVKDADLVFSVSDSGHGISKELLPHLFEEFRRDGKEKQIEGTGLGLFIAKSIVESHHGKIWTESEGSGHGSTFFVELPLV